MTTAAAATLTKRVNLDDGCTLDYYTDGAVLIHHPLLGTWALTDVDPAAVADQAARDLGAL